MCRCVVGGSAMSNVPGLGYDMSCLCHVELGPVDSHGGMDPVFISFMRTDGEGKVTIRLRIVYYHPAGMSPKDHRDPSVGTGGGSRGMAMTQYDWLMERQC